jgi:hypothetical protein
MGYELINEMFSAYGSLLGINIFAEADGTKRGKAIITFRTDEDKDKCLAALNGKYNVQERKNLKSEEEVIPDQRVIYFRRIPMEDHRIEFMFEQYGKIEWISIKEAPRYYKWGYVKY